MKSSPANQAQNHPSAPVGANPGMKGPTPPARLDWIYSQPRMPVGSEGLVPERLQKYNGILVVTGSLGGGVDTRCWVVFLNRSNIDPDEWTLRYLSLLADLLLMACSLRTSSFVVSNSCCLLILKWWRPYASRSKPIFISQKHIYRLQCWFRSPCRSPSCTKLVFLHIIIETGSVCKAKSSPCFLPTDGATQLGYSPKSWFDESMNPVKQKTPNKSKISGVDMPKMIPVWVVQIEHSSKLTWQWKVPFFT